MGNSNVKVIFLFLTFAFLTSCEDDVNGPCQLSKVSYNNGSSNTIRTYEYTEGKLSTYTWDQGVVSKFNYNSNGQVTSIDHPSGTNEISYDANGKPSVVTRKQQSTVIETQVYKWGTNSLTIEFRPAGFTSPIAIESYEFIKDNISKKSVTIYDQSDLTKVIYTGEDTYSEYDMNMNPYYFPSGAWLEYPSPISKNNHKSLVIKQTGYSNGVAQTSTTLTYTLSYKFNSSNAVADLTKILSSSSSTSTTTTLETFTYSNCN